MPRWSTLKHCVRWRQKRVMRLLRAKILCSLKRTNSRLGRKYSGTPHLSVGCVRNDYGMPEQVQFWSVADNVRFGGALMAVKIAEKLVQEYLY
ncbi:Asd/ArgC dimerization domain-containing protein [Escherichia coli]